MLEGMYTAAAGMAAQQRRMDMVSNDLANVSTTGYKHVRVAFRDLLYFEAGGGASEGVRLGAGAAATAVGRTMTQGSLQNTGDPLDVGLQGPGFLQVKLADGRTAMTRDGGLAIDVRNRLTTHTGELLEPAVQLPAGTDASELAIGTDGTVSVGTKVVGRLKLVDVPAPNGLEGGPNNTFLASAASGAVRPAVASTIVQQGTLEASNVDMATSMTSLVEAQRAFELASKAITTQDQAWQVANEVKR